IVPKLVPKLHSLQNFQRQKSNPQYSLKLLSKPSSKHSFRITRVICLP
ncbi:hypothetical protein Nmel_011450, partial [Mimus melanotis]